MAQGRTPKNGYGLKYEARFFNYSSFYMLGKSDNNIKHMFFILVSLTGQQRKSGKIIEQSILGL